MASAEHSHHHGPPVTARDAILDPVCGMTVDPQKSPHLAELDGRTFHFCSAGCRTKFVADPAAYLDKRRAEAAPGIRTFADLPLVTARYTPR